MKGSMEWRRFTIAAALFALGVIGAFLFDRSLQLGDFHGLVFGLYSAYFSGAFLIAMGILAVLNRKEKTKLRAYAFAAFLPIITLLILWMVPQL